ncbi:hypothetical protein CYMTET_44079 [Cymbomonas tetramitiformis]|uniref:AMP-activated protein kinase glycogen-binding domain-containing protein n=1 Tax=Cymbomonas tetramitiformis TaxID=36881 RepID=A0AAE0C275_9CHLO|nr:hypothetical protein CYMTET_44079 [Cymbomonas tetramitiformis]
MHLCQTSPCFGSLSAGQTASFQQQLSSTRRGGESKSRNTNGGIHLRSHFDLFSRKYASRKPLTVHAAATDSENGESSSSQASPGESEEAPTNRFTRAPEGLSKNASVSQVRVYQQLLTLRKKFAERLSESNRNVRQLEKAAKVKDDQIKMMKQRIGFVAKETEAIAKLADDTDYLLTYGVEVESASEKMKQVSTRLKVLHQAMQENVEALDLQSTRTVPIFWEGVAEDVKMMGSFDDWTRGLTLSAEDYTFAGSQLFSGEIDLIPGEYEVKFVVDGEWRCYSDCYSSATARVP